MQITSFKKQQDHFKRMAVDPANHVFRADGEVVPMTPAIRTKIVEQFTHVAEALQDVQNFGGKQATAILKSIQNVIAVHKLEEIKAIFEVVMTLPHNIKVPNVHIIEHIFELIKHPNVVAHKMLKHNAHIAFATILNRACFNKHHPETVF